MARIQVGVIAKRTPTGEFLSSSPIYQEIPDEEINPSGLTSSEEKSCTNLASWLVKPFSEYINKLREAGIPTPYDDLLDLQEKLKKEGESQ